MRLELIQGLQIIIIALLSYIPMVTITGWFEAFVAKKCGDDAPEQFGFLTFDPLVHFNIMGFGCLLVGKLFGDYLPFLKDIPGWGRSMPLSPSSHSKGKVILQFTARALAHLFLLLSSFFVMVLFFKGSNISLFGLTIQPNASLLESLLAVLVFFYRQNFVLCVIYFVIGIFRSILFIYFPDFHLFSLQHMLLAAVALMVSVMVGSYVIDMLLQMMMFGLAQLLVGK